MPEQPILIVQPDAVHRGRMTRLLAQWGHGVESAHSAEETINRMEALHPALVILNANALDSYRLAGEIRAVASDMMIIVTTTAETQVGVMKQFKHLADDYLSIPVSAVALEIRLARAFRTLNLLNEVKTTCSQQRNSRTCEMWPVKWIISALWLSAKLLRKYPLLSPRLQPVHRAICGFTTSCRIL